MGTEQRLNTLRGVRRVVVKIGSGVLSSPGAEEIDSATMKRLVEDICALEQDGRFEVVLVSSGAVMSGRKVLGLAPGPLSIPMKQAAAAAGQVKLVNLYDRYFGQRGKTTAQVLLTHDDIASRRRYLNARNTLTTLLGLGVMPVINENDTVAVHEIKFGDNDTLSAMIAAVVEADLLLILSDVDGLYDADPRRSPAARLIGDVYAIDDGVRAIAGESGSHGTGGMRAKVMAAEKALAFGVPAWIIGGKTQGSIPAALREGIGGTFFHPGESRISARRHWILHILKPQGTVVVDDGAKKALLEMGRSLLPSGIMEVSGNFESGEAVLLSDRDGNELGRGLVNYHAHELRQIMGRKTGEIEQILGYKNFDEAVHRNNMVVPGR